MHGIIQKLYVTIIDQNLMLKFIFKNYFDDMWANMGG